MANMCVINTALDKYASSSADVAISGNGESVASYPQILSYYVSGSPVCSVMDSYAAYSVIKASDSFEAFCPAHGCRSDYMAGKEFVMPDKLRRLLAHAANKEKLAFLGKISLVNLILALILWLPTILLHISGKKNEFEKSLRSALGIHRVIFYITLIGYLPAIVLTNTLDDRTIVDLTAIFIVVSFIVASGFGMACLPPEIKKSNDKRVF